MPPAEALVEPTRESESDTEREGRAQEKTSLAVCLR